ncbi:MAG: tRNA lysidine(34) synthetase TilS, partial [Caulobacterales bacterium]
ESPPLDLALLDRRLNAPDKTPVAVAFSGGGDSLALLLGAKTWSERSGRPLIALTVDHRLRPEGAAWARFAAERAARLGVEHRTLAWMGEKPASGLPAAARAARHALLAEAAREADARVVLMGHTADDVMEAQLMRQAGSSVPAPREWSPSPAWPEGRGVFLLRPLLGCRRADLRDWLADQGERWIEDPANDDPRFARTLARRRLAEQGGETTPPASPPAADLAGVIVGEAGELTLSRAAFRALGATEARRWLAALCLCAAGTRAPPSGAALDRLTGDLAASAPVIASLAGARIEAAGERLLVCREAGEFRRRGIGTTPLPLGESVFDGRFLMIAGDPGWSVRPLRGVARRLPPGERARLAALSAAARSALPAAVGPAGDISCPTLATGPPVKVFSLVGERLMAALGALQDEAALWRVAKLTLGA